MATIARPCAPVKVDPLVEALDRAHIAYLGRLHACHGDGPGMHGLVLECDAPPRLTLAECEFLHGGNHDQAPGDDHALELVSVPAVDFDRERMAEAEAWDWDAEYARELREVERHNREAMGYGSW